MWSLPESPIPGGFCVPDTIAPMEGGDISILAITGILKI
jgi:hypothetical protein